MVENDGNQAHSIANHCVVVGVTRDHAEVWSLEPRQTTPLATVARDDFQAEHRHMRPAQNARGHESDEGFERFFAELARTVADASEVMIAGHGKGKANAMEDFAEYLRDREPNIYAQVTELRYVDMAHTSGRQLAAMAREWKQEQSVRGFGGIG